MFISFGIGIGKYVLFHKNDRSLKKHFDMRVQIYVLDCTNTDTYIYSLSTHRNRKTSLSVFYCQISVHWFHWWCAVLNIRLKLWISVPCTRLLYSTIVPWCICTVKQCCKTMEMDFSKCETPYCVCRSKWILAERYAQAHPSSLFSVCEFPPDICDELSFTS